MEDNYLGSGLLLKKAIEKYGIENFKREILEFCENIVHLNEREKFWIAELNSLDKSIGYNIMKGGDGGDNYTNHPNKEQLSINFSKAQKGKIISDRCRELISAANKGEKNGMFGKKHSKEIREKISLAGLNRLVSDETKKLMSDSKKGIKFTEEHKLNLSKNHKGMKGMKHSEESLQLMRDKKRGSILKKNCACSICGREITGAWNLQKHENACNRNKQL
jgi:hypothetical protein